MTSDSMYQSKSNNNNKNNDNISGRNALGIKFDYVICILNNLAL